jgi:hypothetical protein
MAIRLEKAGRVPADTEYFDLGNHGFSISTTNLDAQKWFNRGLIWSYSFKHRKTAA